jgi:hypothetical protein
MYRALRELPIDVAVGGLRHEAGHATLHGSIRYYIFSMPEEYVEVGLRYGLNKEYLEKILYLTSIAVKDFEVTDLLVRRGFIDCQYAFNSYMLTSGGEEEAWRLAWSPGLRLLHLLDVFKVIASSYPLVGVERYRDKILELIGGYISYLPDEYRLGLIRSVESLSRLKGSTADKLYSLSRVLAREVIEPMLSSGVG